MCDLGKGETHLKDLVRIYTYVHKTILIYSHDYYIEIYLGTASSCILDIARWASTCFLVRQQFV